MRTTLLLAILLAPYPANAQAVQTGRWDVKSTAVNMTIPGAPPFLLRMIKGRSRSERKCLSPTQAAEGVAALLAPDPKAQCLVVSLTAAAGHYNQALICPQRSGPPLQIRRTGTYDRSGFVGRLDMAGQTPKGPMSVTLNQAAKHSSSIC